MVLKNSRFKSCERIYTTDFSLFHKIKSSDMFVLSVPNCSLVENILDTLRSYQLLPKQNILRIFSTNL